MICTPHASRVAHQVSYLAYDWSAQRNTKYTVTMYASSLRECRAFTTRWLGYLPEQFYATRIDESLEVNGFMAASFAPVESPKPEKTIELPNIEQLWWCDDCDDTHTTPLCPKVGGESQEENEEWWLHAIDPEEWEAEQRKACSGDLLIGQAWCSLPSTQERIFHPVFIRASAEPDLSCGSCHKAIKEREPYVREAADSLFSALPYCQECCPLSEFRLQWQQENNPQTFAVSIGHAWCSTPRLRVCAKYRTVFVHVNGHKTTCGACGAHLLPGDPYVEAWPPCGRGQRPHCQQCCPLQEMKVSSWVENRAKE
jgi:hypothetical protein